MKLFEPIVVDLYKPFPLKKVDMQQNNIGRGVIVTLTAGSTIVDPSDEDVKLWAERPDGNISYLACTVQTDGTIRAPFSSQMLSVPGEVVVLLEMINGEDDITTPIFKVGVGRNIANHALIESQNEFTALQETLAQLNEFSTDIDIATKTAETALSIAKGANQAHVFNTTDDMKTWLSNAENAGLYQVGDNIYIVEADAQDWWISEVLTEADAETGYYYKIAQLETQKVDLTNITSDIEKNTAAISELKEKYENTIEEDATPETVALDFSTWSDGSFIETLSDGTTVDYAVTFDSDGKPTKINDCTITW